MSLRKTTQAKFREWSYRGAKKLALMHPSDNQREVRHLEERFPGHFFRDEQMMNELLKQLRDSFDVYPAANTYADLVQLYPGDCLWNSSIIKALKLIIDRNDPGLNLIAQQMAINVIRDSGKAIINNDSEHPDKTQRMINPVDFARSPFSLFLPQIAAGVVDDDLYDTVIALMNLDPSQIRREIFFHEFLDAYRTARGKDAIDEDPVMIALKGDLVTSDPFYKVAKEVLDNILSSLESPDLGLSLTNSAASLQSHKG